MCEIFPGSIEAREFSGVLSTIFRFSEAVNSPTISLEALQVIKKPNYTCMYSLSNAWLSSSYFYWCMILMIGKLHRISNKYRQTLFGSQANHRHLVFVNCMVKIGGNFGPSFRLALFWANLHVLCLCDRQSSCIIADVSGHASFSRAKKIEMFDVI